MIQPKNQSPQVVPGLFLPSQSIDFAGRCEVSAFWQFRGSRISLHFLGALLVLHPVQMSQPLSTILPFGRARAVELNEGGGRKL